MLQNVYQTGLLQTRNASSETIFAPEQDFSALLLTVECPVSDRLLKLSGPSLNTVNRAEIATEPLVNLRPQLSPDVIQIKPMQSEQF